MTYENNLLSILSWASTRSTWVSISSCAQAAGVSYIAAYHYFERDEFGQVASFYHYDYSLRKRFFHNGSKSSGVYLSVVSRGYA